MSVYKCCIQAVTELIENEGREFPDRNYSLPFCAISPAGRRHACMSGYLPGSGF